MSGSWFCVRWLTVTQRDAVCLHIELHEKELFIQINPAHLAPQQPPAVVLRRASLRRRLGLLLTVAVAGVVVLDDVILPAEQGNHSCREERDGHTHTHTNTHTNEDRNSAVMRGDCHSQTCHHFL